MSRDNVAFVQRIYADYGADWTKVSSVAHLERLVDPAIRIDLSRRELNPAVYEGYEGMRRSAEEVREVWEDWRIEAERFVDAGEGRVLVVERYGGRGRESGVRLQGRAAAIWTLRAGRVVGLEIGIPIEEAFAALGLAPPASD